MTGLLPGEQLYPALEPGTRVSWLHVLRAGYGFTQHIPGVVIGTTPTGRVRLQLESGRRVTVTRRAVREVQR